MRFVKPLALATLVGLTAMPAAATAKTPLGEVKEIHDGLMAVGIADQLRKDCDNLSARILTAYGYINSLKSRASELGYSDQEIEDFVTSKDEKRQMRADGEAYLRARGVDPEDSAAFCAFGVSEIGAGTAIGKLLREN
ncbi:DUF5333 domain-containing protein [Salipiger mucosus]|uniref:NADH dehydrogenase subunit E n=1 Tax=Salipiger mucosus DSM 16094 TaxID=1123237 RepID=S9QGA7_9RHOB|nr:DUF5333 domain-containing protein [Salipiger mucosus]EPX80466.1 hypothetical protein Salmuc_03782 [Salipiger mucosus DSM 16094]